MANTVRAELIVLASPAGMDSYYKDAAPDILAFHIEYARQIEAHGDKVLILTSPDFYRQYVEALGADKVVSAPMQDIWMRDFAPSNASAPVMFRYSAAGQGGSQDEADIVQDVLAAFLEETGLNFEESDFINDGGNFVDDYAGNVVMSTKFLADNKLSETRAREILTVMPGIDHVAFIEADEQGGLEHADGVVSFVDTNTLVINSYPEDADYARQLKADLKRGLPEVKIHEIVTPYDDSEIYDERFGSACGLYTNALVTPERVYLPQFGIAEDKIALKQVRAVTGREVVPVASQQVCHMGGGVRCMSWQLRGESARKLLDYVF